MSEASEAWAFDPTAIDPLDIHHRAPEIVKEALISNAEAVMGEASERVRVSIAPDTKPVKARLSLGEVIYPFAKGIEYPMRLMQSPADGDIYLVVCTGQNSVTKLMHFEVGDDSPRRYVVKVDSVTDPLLGGLPEHNDDGTIFTAEHYVNLIAADSHRKLQEARDEAAERRSNAYDLAKTATIGAAIVALVGGVVVKGGGEAIDFADTRFTNQQEKAQLFDEEVHTLDGQSPITVGSEGSPDFSEQAMESEYDEAIVPELTSGLEGTGSFFGINGDLGGHTVAEPTRIESPRQVDFHLNHLNENGQNCERYYTSIDDGIVSITEYPEPTQIDITVERTYFEACWTPPSVSETTELPGGVEPRIIVQEVRPQR